LQQDQLPSLHHPTSESLQTNPEFDEAQQQAAAGAAETLQPLASKLLQQSLASTEDSQTAQAEECQAAAYAQDSNAASSEDVAPAAEAGHIQKAQADQDQPALQSSFSLGQFQTNSTRGHREPEPALVDLSTSQQPSPDATAAGAIMPVQQSLEARMTMDEADAEALDIGSVNGACAEAHHAEVGERFMACAILDSDEASELKASLGQQVFSNVQPGPGTGQLDSDKGEPGFADGQLGLDKGQPEVDDGQPDVSNQSGLPTLQPHVSDGPPGLHSEQPALSVEQLQSRPEQPLLCIAQADAAGRQPDADNLWSTQSEPQSGSLPPQIPANLQMLDCVHDHQHQPMQSQQHLPAVSVISSSLDSHADAQQACMSPLQLPQRLPTHEPAALQSQLSEAVASNLESDVSAQQSNVSPFQLSQGSATHESAALHSQLSEALASSTSELLLLDPKFERCNGEGLSPQRLCSQLLSRLSVQYPGLQQPDSFQLQSAEAIPRSVSALLQLYPGLEQLNSDVTQEPRQLRQSLSCLSRQQPGLERPSSFPCQPVASLLRSVSSLLQLYPGLEQPDSSQCQSFSSLSRSVSSLLQLYPGLKQPDSSQCQSVSSLLRSVSSLLQLYPGLEQPDSFQCQPVASLSRSVSSLLQLYPGLEQPDCWQTSVHADELTKTLLTRLQVYPGLERSGALQSQHQSEPASRSQSAVLQVYPGLEQQYQHTETVPRSLSSALQMYLGLEQLGQQKMRQSAGISSTATLEPPLQHGSRLESAAVNSAQQALGDKADQLLQPPESVCGAVSSQPSNTYLGLEPAASSWAQYERQEGTQHAQQEGAQHARQDGLPSMQDLEAAVALASRQSASEHHLRNEGQTTMMQDKAEQVSAIPPATVQPITAGHPRWGGTDAATQLSLLKVCLHASYERHCYSLPDLSASVEALARCEP